MAKSSDRLKQANELPGFKAPPVTEVVLGIQFDPLEALTTPHIGEYRRRIAEDYPHLREMAPLQRSSETFEGPYAKQEREFKVSAGLPPLRRCWFLDKDDECMVQLDAEHFCYNWRNDTGKRVYPRYKAVRVEFERLWSDFGEFVRAEKIGEIKVNHWEVTYVNHINKGEAWTSLDDLDRALRIWPSFLPKAFLPPTEAFQMTLAYAFPEQKGRLRIAARDAIRKSDMQECVLLKMIAKGRIDSPGVTDVLPYLNMGREWIVRAFADVTTEEAQVLWGKE